MNDRDTSGLACTRRQLVAGGAGAALGVLALPRAVAAATGPVVHVGEFGARGDGVTNDTDAIHAAAKTIEREGGGTLLFDRRVYLVGRQKMAPGLTPPLREWEIVAIRNCPRKVTIAGGGATLKSVDGLKFGSFDPRTGRPAAVELPFYDRSYLATPFRAAILLEGNRGGIEVRDIEIDGCIRQMQIGGKWGDTGWQVPHHGIHLNDNRGPHLVRNVHAHHLGTDGMMMLAVVKSEAAPAAASLIEDCRFDFNGRQGVSLIGGRHVTFRRCRFNHTGRNGVIDSNPHSGVDLEAEHGLIRDIAFEDCEFDANAGSGLVADSGDTARVAFTRCKFVGSEGYAFWPNKPDMVFRQCTIVGPAVGFFSDPSGRRAPKFYDCRFSDDPALGATGRIRAGTFDLGASKGVYFEDCVFDYTRSMQLPYSQLGTRYHNCRMASRAPGRAQLTGTFTGTTIIDGGANLVGSELKGRVIHNGKLISR